MRATASKFTGILTAAAGAALWPVAALLPAGPAQSQAPRSICDAARDARARNSPAAAGLERQCEATKPAPMALGRVKPAPLQLGRVSPRGTGSDTRSICEAAADARARNSPAAAGLERQCAQAPASPNASDAVPSEAEAPVVGAGKMEGDAGDIRLARVYTGGGTARGTIPYDYVELRNRGQAPVSLDGWSLQYASPTGMSWIVTPLTGVISPGKAFVIAAGELHPDQAATIQLGQASGKLALVQSVHALHGACPLEEASVVDFIGYGTATCAFGTAVATETPDLAYSRSENGCVDTRNNEADFTGISAELPRGQPAEPCATE